MAMRVLAYMCAFLGIALAVGGLVEHYLVTDLQILPHLAVILIGGGAGFDLLGFLLFGAVLRRQRQAMTAAVEAFQRSSPSSTHWVID